MSSTAFALGGRPGLRPDALPKPIQRRIGIIRANPLAQPVGVVDGHIERIPVGVLHQQVFALHASETAHDQPLE